ncbi:MAG TPA: hypothetical protein VM115_14655 [Vicinamibacterales bacterium]|nr:hypothetical protein [Vicinamibacterales bacterium]
MFCTCRALWILPVPLRGFGQGTRNNVIDLLRPSDVRWMAELMSKLSDAQWDDAFRAADYSPDVRARFIRKIKAKIAEGVAVS